MRAHVFSNLTTGQFSPAVVDSQGRTCPAPFTTFDEERAYAYADMLAAINPHDDIDKVVFPDRYPRVKPDVVAEMSAIQKQLALLNKQHEQLAAQCVTLRADAEDLLERLTALIQDHLPEIMSEFENSPEWFESLRPSIEKVTSILRQGAGQEHGLPYPTPGI